MGTIFPTDHSGVWGILFGLIGLILFGIMASLLVDGTFTLGGEGGRSGPALLEEQDARLAGLQGELERLRLLESRRKERSRVSARLEGKIGEVAAALLEAEELEGALDAEGELIDRVVAEFEAYQNRHRDLLWRSASGRRMDTLASGDGTVYHDVIITGVSVEGLRIRHRSGVALVRAVLVPKDLRDELLIDLVESQRLIRQRREMALAATEQRRRTEGTDPPPKPRRTNRARERKGDKPAPPDAQTRIEILTLHEEIARLSSRLSQLRTELSEARRGAAGYRRNRSAPGSLETWEERVLRLSKIEQRAEEKLAVLKARLRAIDPGYRSWKTP